MRGLSIIIMLILLACDTGCQPQGATLPDGGSAPAPAGAVALGEVSAQGQCSGTVGAEIILGPLVLPVVVRADTHATAEGATEGAVSLDVGGLLTARCLISPARPTGLCAVGGLAPRLIAPEASGGQP